MARFSRYRTPWTGELVQWVIQDHHDLLAGPVPYPGAAVVQIIDNRFEPDGDFLDPRLDEIEIRKAIIRLTSERHTQFLVSTDQTRRLKRMVDHRFWKGTALARASQRVPANVLFGTTIYSGMEAGRVVALLSIPTIRCYLHIRLYDPYGIPFGFSECRQCSRPKLHQIYAPAVIEENIDGERVCVRHSTPVLPDRCLDWVTISGDPVDPARPIYPEWVKNMAMFASQLHIPFYFQGWGRWVPTLGQVTVAPTVSINSDGRWLPGDTRLRGGVPLEAIGSGNRYRALDSRIVQSFPVLPRDEEEEEQELRQKRGH